MHSKRLLVTGFLSLAASLPVLSVAADTGLSPADAVKAMTVPDGFKVELIASEPDIAQPIAFTFDERGRIWVVEGNTYPQRNGNPVKREPGSGDLTKPDAAQLKDMLGGKDRVLILEDKDGDGTFETKKVFIEGLNLTSGIEVGYGGIYIGAAPWLLHIADADHDDKPDGPPEILLDGFGWQDTHETLNSFTWGPDGWLYGCHGVFTQSLVGAPGTPKEERIPMNCAYWRFHPVAKKFEIFASGTSNSWGHDYNANGDWFSEACVIPHFWHIIQGAYYLRQSNPLGHFNPWVYTNIETIADHQHYIGDTPHAGNGKSDAAGGGHAHCGLCIYQGDNFPDEYRGRALMFNVHGRRINQENLVPEGSGYVAKHLPDLLLANDPWFSGVALKVGPDGALYFIDWYDPQKCHKTDPLVWDRGNGRMYRLKYESTWKPWKGDLGAEDSGTLAAWHKNDWFNRMGRRILAERKTGVGSGFGDAGGPLNSLWQEQTLGGQTRERLADRLAEAAQRPGNGGLLTNLIYAAANAPGSDDVLLAGLAAAEKTTGEAGPRARLAIASALQRVAPDKRWNLLAALLLHGEDAMDHNLPQMYWYAVEPLVPLNPERALTLAEGSRIPLVAEHIARRAAAMDGGLAHLVKALAKEKTGTGLVYLLKAAGESLHGRDGIPAPEGWDGAYANMDGVLARREDAKPLAGEITDLREALAVAFGDRRAFPRLRALAGDAAASAERRTLALQTLQQGHDAELAPILLRLVSDPVMQLTALRLLPAVSGEGAAAVAEGVLSRYAGLPPAAQQAGISALSTRREWAAALLQAIADKRVARADLPSFAARQIAALGEKSLTDRLGEVWGAVGDFSGDAAAEIAKFKTVLTPQFLGTANLPAGRALYNVTCGTCHTLFGQGGKVGPDLTGSNRANLDYVLENVVNPNALIGKDYELHIFTLADGRAVSGMIRGETDAAFTVQGLTSQDIVAKSAVKTHDTPGISMMPAGQLTAFSAEQQRDLVAYLAQPAQVPLPGEPGAEKYLKAKSVPGALEGEGLKILAAAGSAVPQPMESYTRGNWAWSGDAQLWWSGGKPGDQLQLALPVPTAGTWEIQAVLTKAPDYGIVEFRLDGELLGKAFDGFSPSGAGVVHTDVLTLGQRVLTPGDHRLTVVITGTNPEAVKNYMAGIDYLYLKQVQ